MMFVTLTGWGKKNMDHIKLTIGIALPDDLNWGPQKEYTLSTTVTNGQLVLKDLKPLSICMLVTNLLFTLVDEVHRKLTLEVKDLTND